MVPTSSDCGNSMSIYEIKSDFVALFWGSFHRTTFVFTGILWFVFVTYCVRIKLYFKGKYVETQMKIQVCVVVSYFHPPRPALIYSYMHANQGTLNNYLCPELQSELSYIQYYLLPFQLIRSRAASTTCFWPRSDRS